MIIINCKCKSHSKVTPQNSGSRSREREKEDVNGLPNESPIGEALPDSISRNGLSLDFPLESLLSLISAPSWI